MRVCIHRGAHEIGGSCVEVLAEDGSRVLLDVGRPLAAADDEDVPILGLDPDALPLGVFITHPHQDHWGLADQLPDEVPVYLGAAAQGILREAAFWTRGIDLHNTEHLEHRKPLELGPFTVTPYLNDHSGFDAYSLLVEADGERLFYTGDISGHGRKKDIFEELLREPPENVDSMLMEGTHIGQDSDREDPEASEVAVESACAEAFRSAKGLGLALYSAQNIDRLVTMYRATLASDRDFVMDLYSASIAMATGRDSIPRPSADWPRVKVYVPRWQRVKVKKAAAFERVEAIKPFRVFEEDLAANPGHFVMCFSRASGPALAKAGALIGAVAVWSMWDGYLTEPSGEALQAFLADHDIPLVRHHTSGHATIADLKRLVAAVSPGCVVPIHSAGGHRFAELFPSVTRRDDGEWWNVGRDM